MASNALQISHQASLPGLCPIQGAIDGLEDAGIEERGAIFTRSEVVEFILDLVGYTVDQPLHQRSLLEPSFGNGDFLLVVVKRLLAAWQTQAPNSDATALAGALRAVELNKTSFDQTWRQLEELLQSHGIGRADAVNLLGTWLVRGDFLLTPLTFTFDFVTGNPPYVRHELIPNALIAEYRRHYSTIYDRADLYVPFIERGLMLLKPGGVQGFICADRWMKNKYGRLLRQLVAEQYHLRTYVDMTDTAAFHTNVIAYPAITVIAREKPGKTRVAHRPDIQKHVLTTLSTELHSKDALDGDSAVKEVASVASGPEPWILESFDQLSLVRRLERDFPLIEEAGCRVGIGVATGADKAFIGPIDELDVESDRKLPIAMTKDIESGNVEWRGLGIVNPFNDGKGLVDLSKYPKLAAYLEARRGQIDKRHVAQKAPANWYRTIDRIYPSLATQRKLLIPDIKGEAHIVYEDGQLYPHHNLYYIVSDDWNLRALQAVLSSGIAKLFVATYSTRMRGGYLRFQAQYLRRIRVPRWTDVPMTIRKTLIDAAQSGDTETCNQAVFELYALSPEERAALGENVQDSDQADRGAF